MANLEKSQSYSWNTIYRLFAIDNQDLWSLYSPDSRRSSIYFEEIDG